MLGAIIGDIIGSFYEWNNVKTVDFDLFPKEATFTDDTVMTLAVAKWLIEDKNHTDAGLVKTMQELGRKYPNAGYGGHFYDWIFSDNPQPYNSWGNGSAMRVSPVGLYANTLEEALELARISASVTHNHPEGIKGAQAIAACVWLKRHEEWCAEEKIKDYIERNFGYDLSPKLEDLRQNYSFDVSCQGSVPIAIMAYLQRRRTEDRLRLAISMGGDSDTIGCMTASIADAIPLGCYPETGFSDEIISKCRSLLTPELLEINDRFEAFVSRPLYQSYYLERHIFVGEYPGDKDRERALAKIQHMTHFGVRHFIDLTEEGELLPYSNLLPQDSTYTRFPIRNVGVPRDYDSVERLVMRIKELSRRDDGYVYIHSWGGVGRTGTIIACYLENDSYENTMKILRHKYSLMPKSAFRCIPDTTEQENFIRQYISSKTDRMQTLNERIKDCIRGSLMAGAAGDALGYSVEFLREKDIISKYGVNGITQFDIAPNGKALVSDDTQMTLFTANGMLMGLTRGYMRGIGGAPEQYVSEAYVDWYYTQTGIKRPTPDHSDFHCTWLRDIREMNVRRAPGATCLSACDDLMNNKRPQNNSKGCGGLMRVAPMGLLDASFQKNGGRGVYNTQKLAEAGAFIAKTTHLHPLGFLPAALMTLLISRVVPLTPEEVKLSITDIVNDGLDVMVKMYGDDYYSDKSLLKEITLKAVRFAHSNMSDADAIKALGEGWVAEEAWAISLYCTIRHIDNIQDAIIASVNHDGDSDSTGSITGNIMGAIYGYEAIKKERMFCPKGKTLEETIELANIILALADDLFTGCTISEGSKIETPEQEQWYERYCLMKPAGLQSECIYDGTTCPNCGYTQENDKHKYSAKLYGPLPPRIDDTPIPSTEYMRTDMTVGESMHSTMYGAPLVHSRPVVYGPPVSTGGSRVRYLSLIVIIILLIIIAIGIFILGK